MGSFDIVLKVKDINCTICKVSESAELLGADYISKRVPYLIGVAVGNFKKREDYLDSGEIKLTISFNSATEEILYKDLDALIEDVSNNLRATILKVIQSGIKDTTGYKAIDRVFSKMKGES